MATSPHGGPAQAGLYSHPVAAALVNEALALLGDGASAAAIEAAGRDLGMPAGPLWVIDAISLDPVDAALHAAEHAHGGQAGHGHEHGHGHGHSHGHGHEHAHDHGHDHGHAHGHDHDHGHAHGHRHEHAHDHAHGDGHGHDHDHAHHHAHEPSHGHGATQPRQAPPPPLHRSAVYVIEKMAHGFKRPGRAAGAGFYDYSADPPVLWSGLKAFERRSARLTADDIRERLHVAVVLAALGAPDAPSPAGWPGVFGPGVPATAGDAAAHVRSSGPQAFVECAAALAGRFGERFAPSAAAVERLASRSA